jgi:hypothetical protein
MRPIRLWTGIGHISYSEFEAKRSWVHGGFAPAGFVFAARCESCSDVRLIAVPNQHAEADLLPRPAEQEGDSTGKLPLPSGAPSGEK